MKSSGVKSIITIIALALSLQFSARAQFNAEFLKGGVNDGVKLLEAYVTPYANAFGAGFNSSWYNTAKPHALGGFDITLSVNTGLVPLSDRSFDLNSLGFESLTLVNPSGPSMTPTIAGATEPGPSLHAMINQGGYDIEIANFKSPEGIGWRAVPVPMVQLGVGLPLGSELKIRYLPNIAIADGKVSMYGGGLVHSVSQYIKGMSLLPVDVSLFGGYSRLNMVMPLDLQPDSYGNYSTYSAADFMGQEISMYVEAWSANVIGSFNLPIITFYGGLGYSKTKTHAELSGNFPLPTVDLLISTTGPVYKDEGVVTSIDPIDIDNFSGVRINVGTRLKLGVITFHADYTRSNYNVFVGGFGISFR